MVAALRRMGETRKDMFCDLGDDGKTGVGSSLIQVLQ